MPPHPKSPQTKRVGFVLNRASSSRTDSCAGSTTDTTSTREKQFVTYESAFPRERKSPDRQKGLSPPPNAKQQNCKNQRHSPHRGRFRISIRNHVQTHSPQNQNGMPFLEPRAWGILKDPPKPKPRPELKQQPLAQGRSRSPGARRGPRLAEYTGVSRKTELSSPDPPRVEKCYRIKKPLRQETPPEREKLSKLATPSEAEKKSGAVKSPTVKSILKNYKEALKSPARKARAIVPIIRESAADIALKHEVSEYLKTLPTLQTVSTTDERGNIRFQSPRISFLIFKDCSAYEDKISRRFPVYSERIEFDKTCCDNLRGLFTYIEHKIHDIRYTAEFYDVDLRKLWLNPLYKNGFRIKPGSLTMERRIGSGSFGVVYCAYDKERGFLYFFLQFQTHVSKYVIIRAKSYDQIISWMNQSSLSFVLVA